jgi:hypothetical protein
VKILVDRPGKTGETATLLAITTIEPPVPGVAGNPAQVTKSNARMAVQNRFGKLAKSINLFM